MSESNIPESEEISQIFGELPDTIDEKIEEYQENLPNTDKFYLNKLLTHKIFTREKESELAYHIVKCYNNLIPIIKSTPYIIPILEKIISEEEMENVDKNRLRYKVKKFQTMWGEIEKSASKLNGNKKKYNQYMQELEAKKDEIKNIKLDDYLRQYSCSIFSKFIELMEKSLKSKKGIIKFKISHEELKLLYSSFYENYEDYKGCVDEFAEHNQKLVYSCVLRKKFRKDFDSIRPDLFQEGNMGMLRAINSFDPERNNKFSVYAVYWINQYIRRYIDNGGLIRIPVGVVKNVNKVRKACIKLEAESNKIPTNGEIASAIGMTEEQVEKLILLPIIVPNLRVLEEDTEVELTDLIGDDTYSPDIIAEGRITKEDLNSLLQGELTPKEEMVIRFRFGFGTDECTLEEIGEKWDRSRERIRQIEKKALRKLKLKISEYYKELC